MASGHYVAVLVPHTEAGTFLSWMDTYLASWGPLPCTQYTRQSYTDQLWRYANQDLVAGTSHYVPFLVEDDRELMFTKLSWNVIQHYPWDQHPM